MIYLPVATEIAARLSAELYNLTRPERELEDVTHYLFPWIANVNRPEVSAIILEDTYTVPVSGKATGGALAEILKPFIALGNITQKEIDVIVAQVQEKKGNQTYKIYDLVPDSWKAWVMTKKQAEDAGYRPLTAAEIKALEERSPLV